MNRIYLTIILIGTFCQVSLSQDYVPFPTDYSTWNTLFYGQYSATDIYTINYQYQLNGDTIIKGRSYKKMYYLETDSENAQIAYIGGMREDSEKQIYFFPASASLPTISFHTFPNDTTEHLLYTFNGLEVGTILPINEGANQITVLGIDSVQIGNSYRKRYEIQNNSCLSTEFWIEGIGSTKEFLSAFTYEFEWTFYTLCFSNDNLYYINSPDEYDYCHYMVGVEFQEIDQVLIYPNPASDVIRVATTLPGIINVSVFNLKGQLIQRKNFNPTEDELDISQLEPGVYFVRLIAGNKKYFSKLVKK